MGPHQPTRVASGAQRSGAATHSIVYLAMRHEYCATVAHDLAFSFFVARTPARWLQKRLWASVHRSADGPGGAVLWFYTGQGGRTGKPLKNRGSMVLFCGSTRDVCTGACAHACREYHQNHRTIELPCKSYVIEWFSGSGAVLYRFCSVLRPSLAMPSSPGVVGGTSTRIKIKGGYSIRAASPAASADQGLFAGSAGGKFQARMRLAGGPIGEVGALVKARCGNDGFLPISAGVIASVGTAMLECSAETGGMPCLSGVRSQLGRLSAPAAWTPRGVASIVEGATPPSAARPVSRSRAQPIFQVSAQPAFRGVDQPVMDLDGRLFGCAGMGSGDRRARRLSATQRGDAGRSDLAARVGDGGVSCAVPMRHRVPNELWAGGAHVN